MKKEITQLKKKLTKEFGKDSYKLDVAKNAVTFKRGSRIHSVGVEKDTTADEVFEYIALVTEQEANK